MIHRIILLVMIKIYLRRRRYNNELKRKAISISKDFLYLLNRQLMVSVKSPQCKAYVLEEQVRDAEQWKYVKLNVK